MPTVSNGIPKINNQKGIKNEWSAGSWFINNNNIDILIKTKKMEPNPRKLFKISGLYAKCE